MDFWTIILWIWIAGSILTIPMFAKFLYMGVTDGDGETFDKVMSVAMGMCSSWLWPLCIPGYWVYAFTFGREDK